MQVTPPEARAVSLVPRSASHMPLLMVALCLEKQLVKLANLGLVTRVHDEPDGKVTYGKCQGYRTHVGKTWRNPSNAATNQYECHRVRQEVDKCLFEHAP